MMPSGMTAGATKSGASLATRTLIVKFLSEIGLHSTFSQTGNVY